ncbi:hypothetical protein [Lysinibacillus xylanilyticus]|uniref:hypothetical protein n=1 Tax=Lysinibacillus xylanilyticus TaxID=582475 RepID=UPI0036D9FEA5
MKLTCNELLEAPLMNLIKLYDSLNTKGVCGIFTPGSKHNVEHTTMPAMGLLSYCNDLIVTDQLTDKLKLVDIELGKGVINYFNIANASGDILSVPEHLTSEALGTATNPISFKLLVGATTASSPLTEEDVYTFVTSNTAKGYEFTGVPMPLLSKNLLQFKATRDNGMSTIQCKGVPNNILEELFSSLKVE